MYCKRLVKMLANIAELDACFTIRSAGAQAQEMRSL